MMREVHFDKEKSTLSFFENGEHIGTWIVRGCLEED